MKTFKTFIHEAAYHPTYKEWGWIQPNGNILSSISTPEIKDFIENEKKNKPKYEDEQGAMHFDIIHNFTEYGEAYQKIDMEDRAMEDGWVRYFVENDDILYLNVFFYENNITIQNLLKGVKKIVASYDSIVLDLLGGRVIKINSTSLVRLKNELEKILNK